MDSTTQRCLHEEEKAYVFDFEVFPNFFYALFLNLESGDFHDFTVDRLGELKHFVDPNDLLIGYNNRAYDDIVLRYILDGHVSTCEEIYHLSQTIVSRGRDDKRLNNHRWGTHPWKEIDLMQVKPPSLTGKVSEWSLKKHQIRLRWPDVRDLPYPFDKTLSLEEIAEVEAYCKNDVLSTKAVFEDFRQQGVFDVARAISDLFDFVANKPFYTSQAQLASKILSQLYRHSVGIRRGREIKQPAPTYFEPRRYINEAVAFSDRRNQKVLEYLRTLPSENVVKLSNVSGRPVNTGCKEWGQKYLADVKLYAGTVAFRLGVGGIHSDFPQRHLQGHLIDFDVTSYYPSLIRQAARSPYGLTDEWLKHFIDLYEKRIAFKREGNKAAADVMKIVINSVYGQLNYPKSDSFDPSMLLQVTLNGQLFLVMLAEMFAEAGFTIVSANTDGILIDVGNRKEQALEIHDRWMEQTSHKLEHEEYSRYVCRSVNDYFAVTPDGKIKRKGLFNVGSGLKPTVIPEAVIAHYVEGKEVEAYVRSRTSIHEFIRAGQARKGMTVTWRNEPLQRNNRWYYSTNGSPIFQEKEGGRRNLVSGSEHCVPVNHISDSRVPDDLDFDYYIDEAKKIINGIDDRLGSASKTTDDLLHHARTLQDQGLSVLPKGRKDQPKANLPGKIPTERPATKLDDYPWYRHNGIGILTGKNFGVLAVDVDDLERAWTSGLFGNTGRSKSHLATWHQKGSRKQVVAGEIRGTILYQFEGDDLSTTDARFAKTFGFEILYGGKLVQALGVHPNGEPYQYGGSIKPLSTKLLKFLIGCQKELGSPTRDQYVPPDFDPDDGEKEESTRVSSALPRLEQFKAVANADPDYSRLGGLVTTERNGQPRLEGPCPHDHHDSSGSEFTVKHDGKRNRYYGHCFHQQCKETTRQWIARIADNIVCDVNTVADLPCETREAKDIEEATNLETRYVQILAPTGSGKTFNVAKHIAHRLLDQDDATKFVILCSSKAQMTQFAEEFCRFLEADDINQFGIDLIESSGSIKHRDTESRDSVRDGTRVAITHFTYVSRKGISRQHYSFLKFIDADTEVFIDESDNFVDSQRIQIQLGWRGKLYQNKGEPTYIRTTQCLVSSGSGNCAQCKMRKYDGNNYTRNVEYQVRTYTPRSYIPDTDRYEDNPHVEIDPFVERRVTVGLTAEALLLRENREVRDLLFDDDDSNDPKDFVGTVTDLIQTSHCPTGWRHFISLDGEEITTHEVVNHYINDKGSLSPPSDELLLFPYSACNIITLTLTDKLPIQHISQAKRVACLTATLSNSQRRFFAAHLPALEIYTVAPEEQQKVDSVVVLGMNRRFNKKSLVSLDVDRILRFKNTKKRASKEFDDVRRTCNVVLAQDLTDYQTLLTHTSNRHQQNEHKVMITHSGGNLGRGVNLPEYPVVVLDASVYKPMSAYASDSTEDIVRAQEEDKAAVIVQNIGRVLRKAPNDVDREQFRLIVIERLNGEEELGAIADAIQPMCKQPVETLWIRTFVPYGKFEEVINETFRLRQCPDNPPVTVQWYEDFFYQQGLDGLSLTKVRNEIGWKRMSRYLSDEEKEQLDEAHALGYAHKKDEKKQRRAEQRKALQNETKQQKWVRRIAELRSEGITFGKIKSLMNVSRKCLEDQAWFDTAGYEEYLRACEESQLEESESA